MGDLFRGVRISGRKLSKIASRPRAFGKTNIRKKQCLFVLCFYSGYWKATGPNKFIGRGTQVADFCRGFSKGNFRKLSEKICFRKFWKISFGKSSTQIGNLRTPTYKFIWPGCLPVPRLICLWG